MKTKFTRLLLILLAAIMLAITAAATDKTELSIISANVSGLPSIFSKYDRNVPSVQKTLGKMLNESGYDIICVQEDFQYHAELSAEMSNYPYTTYTSGGVPMGDGLNIFSKYPFYNVERITWKEYNGIFADGMDGLCPKGFIKCTVEIDGILIDLYNVHGDSYRTDADQYAKKAQLIQLTKYISKNSKDRPVIITGDTNLTFHNDPLAEMYRILIEENGFTDVWVKMKNGGNYMQGEDGKAIIDAWYNKFGGHDWGRWDSVERVLYRNGDGLKLNPFLFEYKIYTDDKDEIKSLTDHRMMECIIRIDASEYERPDVSLIEVKEPSFFGKITHGIGMLLRFLSVLLLGICTLLITITASSIFMKILLGYAVFCIVYGLINLVFRKNHKAKKWLLLGLPLLIFYICLLIFFANAGIRLWILLLVWLILSLPSFIF